MEESHTTKEKIVFTALELFSRKGIDGVSISDITGKVGIAKSSLYTHFPTKESILDHIFEIYRREISERSLDPVVFDKLAAETAPEDFWNMILDRYLETWKSRFLSQISRLIVLEQYKTKTALALILEETRRILELSETVFEKMIEYGKITPFPPRDLACEYAYAIRGMLLEYDVLTAHNEDTTKIIQKMRRFIRSFCEKIKIKKKE